MLKRVELAQGLNVKMQKSSRLSDIAGCCPIGLWSESPQVSGLRARAHAVSMSCCPIEVSEFKESEAIPDDASYDCEQTGKAMRHRLWKARSESGADHFFYPSLDRALKCILWDDCVKNFV